jgi:probable HAF family extracellular repeat protein
MPNTYNYTSLTDPSATTGTFAYGLNDKGQIVGYYYDGSGNAHGFRYGHGFYTTLDFQPGTNQTFPEGINDKGQIVGWYNDRSSDHGFAYSGGIYTGLDDPSATVNTFARDINDKGQIVGYYQNGLPGGGLADHGFLYSGGVYTTLDDPLAVITNGSGTANGTAALGLNDKGQIVGYYYDGSGNAHGFRYSHGFYTTLDDPSGVDGTFATGINDKGQIVGYYYDNLHNQHGFLYSGGIYTLDDPLGTKGTYATGINDKSQIVGYYIDGSGVEHGYLANPTEHKNSPDKVTVAGPTGTLLLDRPSTFTGKVADFGAQESIDLPRIRFGVHTTLGYSENSSDTGGILSVKDGTNIAKLALLGNYMATSFVTAAVGHGGTLVTEAAQTANQLMPLAMPHTG